MVFKPFARPSKQPMFLLYMVQEGLPDGFKTICKALHMDLKTCMGNVVMFIPNKIKNNKKILYVGHK